jgi:CHAD domain-containing protein
MRAAFRAFKSVLPTGEITEFAAGFKAVAAALGNVRDLDVYLENFGQEAAEVTEDERAQLMDYHQHVVQQRKQARDALLACFGSSAYEQLKQRFGALLDSGPPQSRRQEVSSLTIRDAACKIIPKQHKKVLRAGRAIETSSPDHALHALRIDCKRLRYLLEFFQPVYGEPLDGFVRRLKNLQDVLGEFQDACVATQRLRAYAAHVPPRAKNRGQLVALGQLIHSQRLRAADRRARFKKAWKRFDRKGERKRLRGLLAAPTPDDDQVEECEGDA